MSDNPVMGKRRNRRTTPRGPERWARAAINSVRSPNSKAGRLFLQRASLAFHVAEECRNTMDVAPDQAYALNRPRYPGMNKPPVKERVGYTCSVFCTVMQIQLDFSVSTLESISAVFSTNHVRRNWSTGEETDTGIPKVEQVNRKSVRAVVRCQYCGGRVKR